MNQLALSKVPLQRQREHFIVVAAATAVLVAAVTAIVGFELLSARLIVALDDGAQLVGGGAAAICCWVTARYQVGVQRRWRIFMALGMTGWTVGQAIWSWYRNFQDTPLPSPSLADFWYLLLPIFALPGLLVFAADSKMDNGAKQSLYPWLTRMVLVLDGLIIVGSLFILTWATTLGAVVDAGAPSTFEFLVAIAYPVSDLLLVVMVAILVTALRVSQQYWWQLGFLGGGLVALSISDSIFAYLVSSGSNEMPAIVDAGFIVGPVMIALAALAPVTDSPQETNLAQKIRWTDFLMPYLPLTATVVFIAVQIFTGTTISLLEGLLGLFVVILVIVRQMVTLIENELLLTQVRDGQQRLTYQAFHDSLTGLANRALMQERISQAVTATDHKLRLALIFIDLDDFKTVNDRFGHAGGDQLLTLIAQRLRHCVRSTDTVARIGGDEFAILLADGELLAKSIGERVLEKLGEPFTVQDSSVTVGASIGIAVANKQDGQLTADVLLQHADAAMYTGKRQGKNTLVIHQLGL